MKELMEYLAPLLRQDELEHVKELVTAMRSERVEVEESWKVTCGRFGADYWGPLGVAVPKGFIDVTTLEDKQQHGILGPGSEVW